MVSQLTQMHHVVQSLQQRKSNFGQVLVLEMPVLQVLQQSSERQPGHKDPSQQYYDIAQKARCQ